MPITFDSCGMPVRSIRLHLALRIVPGSVNAKHSPMALRYGNLSILEFLVCSESRSKISVMPSYISTVPLSRAPKSTDFIRLRISNRDEPPRHGWRLLLMIDRRNES